MASWTDSDAIEVMAIRPMPEPYTAQLTELRALCDRMDARATEQAPDLRDELARGNHDFHLLVLRCAASPRLYGIAANLARAPMMRGSFQLYDSRQLGRGLQDHRELAHAIALRDAAAARAVMEAHLRLSYLAVTTAPTQG